MKYVILGIVQGLTEFLPVSSSGHLVIFQHMLGITQDVVFLDIVLHLGTLCSLLAYFRRDVYVLVANFITAITDMIFRRRLFSVWRYDDRFRLSVYIIIATLITGVIVKSGKHFFESQFESLPTVIIGLFITSVILFLTKNFYFGQRFLKHLTIKDAIIAGLAQTLAVIPGISRSGATISALLFRNIDSDSAFNLSFLMSIPAILGAFLFKFKEVDLAQRSVSIFNLSLGFIASFITGLFAIYFARLVIKSKNFYKFSYYCFIVAVIVLILKLNHIL